MPSMLALRTCVLLGCILAPACRRTPTDDVDAKMRARILQPAAEKWREDHGGACPDVERLRVDKEIAAQTTVHDPWGRPFAIRCDDNGTRVVSFGADRVENTADDVVVGRDPPTPRK